MISNLQIKQGTKESPSVIDIDISKPTIFVGPNNSGKSLLLREIQEYLSTSSSQNFLLVNNIDVQEFSEEEILKDIDTIRVPSSRHDTQTNIPVKKPIVYGGNYDMRDIHWPHIANYLANSSDEMNKRYFLEQFYSLFILRLDGRTRFALTEPTPSADLSGPSMNHLMSLFQNDEYRKELRNIIYDALGIYFVIDPTGMNEFRIRFSKRAPKSAAEEQSLDKESREFHKKAINILDMSDGVKAFTGILSSMFSFNYKTILVDEPEAFLHPPLARKLGLRLTQLSNKKIANLLMATHSSNFVMGCIESGLEVNIVRLTYNNDVSSSKVLDHKDLITLMKDPLLRSTGVISSLFHEKVIITEADADRSFYQEINLRMIEKNNRGVKDCLFLNAQNKQTTSRIMKPLKDLGIPVASILDIDVIKEGGTNWTNLLKGAHIPEELHSSLNNLRQSVKKSFENTGKDMKRDGGVKLLKDGEQVAFWSLANQLAQYGVFIVPGGELESWLSYLEIGKNKSTWLTHMFEALGSDPTSEEYVKPREEDVWKFISSIADWFDN